MKTIECFSLTLDKDCWNSLMICFWIFFFPPRVVRLSIYSTNNKVMKNSIECSSIWLSHMIKGNNEMEYSVIISKLSSLLLSDMNERKKDSSISLKSSCYSKQLSQVYWYQILMFVLITEKKCFDQLLNDCAYVVIECSWDCLNCLTVIRTLLVSRAGIFNRFVPAVQILDSQNVILISNFRSTKNCNYKGENVG